MSNFFASKSKTQEDQSIKSSSETSSKKDETVYTGFLAQEVQEAADAVNFSFSGVIKPETEKNHYSLRYSDFVVPIVNRRNLLQQHLIFELIFLLYLLYDLLK